MPRSRRSSRIRRYCRGAGIVGVGGPEGALSRAWRRPILVAAGPARHVVAAGPDGPRAGGAATAEALRARFAKGTERTGKHLARACGAARPAAAPDQGGIRDARARPIEVALRVEPAMEAPSDHQATRAGACGCSACIAPGPGTGTCSSRRWPTAPASPALLAHQRLRRASPAGAGGRGCTCWRPRTERRGGRGPRPAGGGAAWAICPRTSCERAGGSIPRGAAATCGGAPLSQRSLAAGAQHERQLAHGQLDAVLRGDFDLIAAREGAGE